MKLNTASRRRIEVFELRLRIELATIEAYHRVCQPENPLLFINNVPGRLSIVIGLVPPEEVMEAAGLVRLVRHVYGRASDILHGRSSMVDAPAVIIDEWCSIVERLETLVGVRSTTPSN
ncbi:hypothetical protein [Streptomyces sparsogenes]|uniref:Uncharacterized protein n=1 Tax=Streptomyces sparsogenes DSM 40356 TaxID=1331668 RepID=A0A1R1SPD8_9ACTN|nr:hypothetical protein [Streptomyces sparsogenes]OMI40181.1 hypothetical protein SPAR_07317 [Streptomyces sparsogenes DSM 40356]